LAGDARAGKPKRQMSGLSEINKRNADGSFFRKDLEHVRLYIKGFEQAYGESPSIYQALSSGMADFEHVDIIYPVGDPVFVHIFRASAAVEGQAGLRYVVIEPIMDGQMEVKYRRILELILREAPKEPPHESQEQFVETMVRLFERVTREQGTKGERGGLMAAFSGERVEVDEEERRTIRYYLLRDLVEQGVLEGILRDPYIEDIHSVGMAAIHIVHKIFGMMETNVKFRDPFHLDEYLRNMSERIGKPVSEARPIIDGSMPDGSRINIIYSEDVSKRGASFTIRKFTEKPITVVQICQWGTVSPEIAAYMWLALENGMNCIVSGETASGKTTTLNSMLTLISHENKVYTAEDTPEVVAPQPVWQRLVSRDVGPTESRVQLFDLLRAALRSRPNYIIVGEVRGVEGAVMFQAMQTGHSVLSTFHAPSTKQMIQRFTGDPINVPIRFMDNLNIAFFQAILYEGGRLIRRCTSVDEILRYSKDLGGVLTRSVFRWDPYTDTHFFRGMNNSFILEEKIAPRLKLRDKRVIYDELKFRARVIKEMVDRNIVEYDRVNAVFFDYYKLKVSAMPPEERSIWWQQRLQTA
jgi:flagellar protein FlaI